MRHELEETPQQIFDEVWKSIVIKKGEIDAEQVKLELSDYYHLMTRIAEVYCEVSGGRLSKPTHMAESILSEYHREMEESFELGEKESEERIKVLKTELERLNYIVDGMHPSDRMLAEHKWRKTTEAQDARIRVLEEGIQAAWRYAEIVCEGMDGRPTADDTDRLVAALAATKEEA